MSHYKVWLEQCKTCDVWTRVVPHPQSREPIVQALHEPKCTTFPPLQRVDGREITR